MRSTLKTYGTVAKLLHWISALLLVGLVIVGLQVAELEGGPEKQSLEGLHISVGLLLLALMVVRLLWKLVELRPADPPDSPPWQNVAARVTHWALYATIFFQIGIGVISEGQRPIHFFNLFAFGPIVERNPARHEFLEEVHASAWIVIAVLAGLHVIAALYHHFVKRDNVLRRMTTG
jgi:cytochrome b561